MLYSAFIEACNSHTLYIKGVRLHYNSLALYALSTIAYRFPQPRLLPIRYNRSRRISRNTDYWLIAYISRSCIPAYQSRLVSCFRFRLGVPCHLST